MSKDIPAPRGPEVYRGNANTWECDEMGHMNVRFYVAKADDAVQVLLAMLGLAPSVQKQANAIARVVDYHVRFLGEVHPGGGLFAHGGVLDASEEALRLFIDMRHVIGDRLNATFNVVVKLDRDGTPIPFPANVLERARALMMDLPSYGEPRSLHLDASAGNASLARTEELGLTQVNLGTVTNQQCDEYGLMRGEWFMGRVSDGIGNLIRTFNPERGKPGSNVGGAALEYRIVVHRRPAPGDVIAIRSGLAGVGDKTIRLGHWMVDLVKGDAVATMEAAAGSLDLTTRRLIPNDDARKAELQKHIKDGLAI